jgi:predicted transposase YbfD/YdcC
MTRIEALARMEDHRRGPARRHDLHEMILIALCVVMCGSDSWVDVADWGGDNEAWLKKYLKLKHGTVSHDTYRRVFRGLDAQVFETCFRDWISGLTGIVEGVVAIDGKAARCHWAIENSLHWVLDVTFRENECRVRKGHVPRNFSALRKFACSLLRSDDTYPKRSLRSRRKTADRLPEYRASLLGLTPRGHIDSPYTIG